MVNNEKLSGMAPYMRVRIKKVTAKKWLLFGAIETNYYVEVKGRISNDYHDWRSTYNTPSKRKAVAHAVALRSKIINDRNNGIFID